MPFVDETPKSGSTEFKKTEFYVFSDGINVIRVIEPKAIMKWTHFVGRAYVECLGQETCPICRNNKTLQIENPDNYKTMDAYVPARRRFYANVIDRTLGKVCPQCKTEHKGTPIPAHCSKCQTLISDIPLKPLNTFKVLAGGPTLFEDTLGGIEKAILNPETMEPLGIMSYDITLMAQGSGKDRTITSVTTTIAPLDFDVDASQVFDLGKALVKLQPKEMIELMRGVTLKDIFAGRKASANEPVNSEPKMLISEGEMLDIQGSMEKLFKG